MSCNMVDNDLNSSMSDVLSTCSALSYSTVMTNGTLGSYNGGGNNGAGNGGDLDSRSNNNNSTTMKRKSRRSTTTAVPFDLAVVDTTPVCKYLESVPGALQYAISAYPLIQLPSKIWTREQIFFNQASSGSYTIRYYRIVVVGATAMGIELLCCIASRFEKKFAHLKHLVKFEYTLIDERESLEQAMTPWKRLGKSLQHNIFLNRSNYGAIMDTRVSHVHEKTIDLDNGTTIPYDMLVWATEPSAPELVRHMDCAVDSRGLIRVNRHLQSLSRPMLFAAGDCISIEDYEGVTLSSYNAIRMGTTLTTNIIGVIQQMGIQQSKSSNNKSVPRPKMTDGGRRPLLHQHTSQLFKMLEKFKPKGNFFHVIDVGGGGRAVGQYWFLCFGPSKWVLSVKNRRTTKFVHSFPQAQMQPSLICKIALVA